MNCTCSASRAFKETSEAAIVVKNVHVSVLTSHSTSSLRLEDQQVGGKV